MKKIRPSHKFTYLTFLILFVALSFLLWAIFGTKPWSMSYNDYVSERLWVELTYLGISFLVCALGAFIYRLKVYYLVNDKMIVYHGKKETEYHFNDIVYLDEAYTNRHNDMLIYINTGKWVNLTMDPKKEIYNLVKKHAKLLSEEQFNFKYPNARKIK